MLFGLWRPTSMLSKGYFLERAIKARNEALRDLPAGATGSRNAPWNLPKILMGLGLALAVPGFMLTPYALIAGAVLFGAGLVIAIVSAITEMVHEP